MKKKTLITLLVLIIAFGVLTPLAKGLLTSPLLELVWLSSSSEPFAYDSSRNLALVTDKNNRFKVVDCRNGGIDERKKPEDLFPFYIVYPELLEAVSVRSMDDDGSTIYPTKYYNRWTNVFNLDSELAPVFDYDDAGFVDKKGEIVIPRNFYCATPFVEGLAAVEKERYEWGYIDEKGNIVIPCEYDFACPFSEGLAAVEVDYQMGFIDKNNNFVIEAKYTNLTPFSEGLAGAKLDGEWGFIDKKDKLVIPHQYDQVKSFSDGVAAVEKDWKWGYIDAKGKVVLPLEYDSASSFVDDIAIVEKNGYYRIINKEGEHPIDGKYDDYGYVNFTDKPTYWVKKGSKYGILVTHKKSAMGPILAIIDAVLALAIVLILVFSIRKMVKNKDRHPKKSSAPATKSKGVLCKCGHLNDADAKFCAKCGQALEAKEKGLCPNCGTKNPENSTFCGKCGERLK